MILPLICFVVGLILMFIGFLVSRQAASLSGIIFLIGLIIFLFSFILPFYFLIKGLITSVEELSSKEKFLRIAGIIGILFAISFILTLSEQFSGIIKIIPLGLIAIIILFLALIFLFFYVIYIFIKTVLGFLYKILINK